MSEQPVNQPQPAQQVESPATAPATPSLLPAAAPAQAATPAPVQDEAWRQNYENLVNYTKTVAPGLFEQYKQNKKGEPAPIAQQPVAPAPVVQQQPKQFLDMTEEDFGKVLEQKVATHIANAVNSALTQREQKAAFERERQEVAVHLSKVVSEAKLSQNDPLVTQTIEQIGQLGIDVNSPGGPSQFAQLFTVMLKSNILEKIVSTGSASLAQQQAAQQAAANQVAIPAGPSAPSAVPMDDTNKLIAAMQVQSGVRQRIFDEP